MNSFTHIDDHGRVRMVDVSEKEQTARAAIAKGVITMNADTFDRILNQQAKKGNVLETARIAGIMAAKKTAELIPMCHPINITHVSIDFIPKHDKFAFEIHGAVKIMAQTGVEMEALTAVSIAALTIYDMCKSYDRQMVISDVHVAEKSGGKSGHLKNRER